MNRLEQKIEVLEAKRKANEEKLKLRSKRLKDKINQIRAMAKKDAKKHDTRRKILAGAMLLDQISKDAQAKAKFNRDINAWLSRDIDRALFGLELVGESSKNDKRDG
jgi:hypothetical protein